MEISYSTPTQYIQALSEVNNDDWNKTGQAWSVRHDDMFPYDQNPQRYWNGYYTSRPQLKKHIRDLSTTYHSSLRLMA